MSRDPADTGSEMTQPLIDLLWESEELAVGTPPDDEDRRIRDQARTLMQRQAEHCPVDGATEWSEMDIELPLTAKRMSRPRPAPARRPNLSLTEPHRTEASVLRKPSRPRMGAQKLAATARPEYGKQREVILRIIRLLVSPEVQRKLASRLPGTSLQQEIARLWFAQYRPVQCEEVFSASAASGLRGLSARLRQLLARRELWSCDIDVLLEDQDWRELAGRAEFVLSQEASELRRLKPAGATGLR